MRFHLIISYWQGSKGALISLFDTLRVEIGSDVKITLVDPGLVETEMTTVTKSMSNDDAVHFTNERWTKVSHTIIFFINKALLLIVTVLFLWGNV